MALASRLSEVFAESLSQTGHDGKTLPVVLWLLSRGSVADKLPGLWVIGTAAWHAEPLVTLHGLSRSR